MNVHVAALEVVVGHSQRGEYADHLQDDERQQRVPDDDRQSGEELDQQLLGVTVQRSGLLPRAPSNSSSSPIRQALLTAADLIQLALAGKQASQIAACQLGLRAKIPLLSDRRWFFPNVPMRRRC